MSIRRTIQVWAECGSQTGWQYNLAELEAFIAECREAGFADDQRAIVINAAGQMGATMTITSLADAA